MIRSKTSILGFRQIYNILQILTLVVLFNNSAIAAKSEQHVSANHEGFDAKIAIVDVEMVLANSIAIQNIRKTVEALSQEMQTEIDAKDKELESLEQDLLAKRDSLNEEDFDKELIQLNQKANEVQKEIKNKKNHLEQTNSSAVGKIYEETISIITELAKTKNFNIVLPSSQVIFATNNLNITKEVIDILNQKITSVPIRIE